MTSKRIIALGVTIPAAIVVAAGAVAFYAPSPHEVHTPGGRAVNAQLVVSDKTVYAGQPIQPSEYLDDVRCEFWRQRRNPPLNCPDSASLASLYFPELRQSPKTLYLPWGGCPGGSNGRDGSNVEYLPASRTLVIHCYTAESLMTLHWAMPGVRAMQAQSLLLIPTDSLSAGVVTIVEEDRIEHLTRDWSTEVQLGTATIS
jgi:hypothetical protein